MHHLDFFPKGNGDMEVPKDHIKDRNPNGDFDFDNDFRMYYGKTVPGFPVHPHRGFETVTIVLQGFVDHSDSAGLSGRYGAGDVQWMTAGKGMQHAEMFPLVNDDKDNTLELFQVWLNLPSKSKFVDPHYKMLWNEDIPIVVEENEDGNKANINVITGSYNGTNSLDPNPDSWAFDRDNHVNIWTIHLEPGASFTLPKVSDTLNRTLYLYQGKNIKIDETTIDSQATLKLAGDQEINVVNGNKDSYLLLLEGEPINEPAINYGPFVMNTMDEINEAYKDYEETKFGGWPWDRVDPVNPSDSGRFAKYGENNIDIPK
ncbi:pirin family protein [Clostridium sp. D2Q-11]|uniref:Pirin family protein n=2 Tax=Anaeromonas frigoriresistens TaxID=2683708 RepID=A0A942UUU7_9FIRM|nr:pirin family protein [Anaeromonas frigoriresistens]